MDSISSTAVLSILLDDDIVSGGNCSDGAVADFTVDVGGASGSNSLDIGGDVDEYEDNISAFDFGVHVGGEKEVGNLAVTGRIICFG